MATTATDGPSEALRLRVDGMTCATCSQRIEKVLRRQPGVLSAHVNLATETAHVAYRPEQVDALPHSSPPSSAAGYGAAPALSDQAAEAERLRRERSQARREWTWLAVSIALTLPLVAPMGLAPFGRHWMLPGWLQLVLATPVQFVIGARFYRGAWARCERARATWTCSSRSGRARPGPSVSACSGVPEAPSTSRLPLR